MFVWLGGKIGKMVSDVYKRRKGKESYNKVGKSKRTKLCVTQSIIGTTYDDNIFWLRLKEGMALIFYGVLQNWACSLLSAYATFITSLSLPDFFC